ncbi:DUF1749-domain-containing protein [Nadsonia fulvescens var. elongata DSM 6958]|uniref:DUF1749-domain-containing protein n=1 Tax=Nadsonia fulvescens var. elongata DSM 6958 TaxID=857566 RepID=A0A1E3PM58_9ASCO|nr:DUF1749-domain-containing protein [Nadsonia fulvescens var. elongata DSM 6958]
MSTVITGTTIHKYHRSLIALEHPSLSNKSHDSIVLFIGGLGDGLTTVPYVSSLAKEIDAIGWGLVEILTSSSYIGWGTGSLARDAFEITNAINYFKSRQGESRKRIVLLGHSTGTQDIMYYLTQEYNGDSNLLSVRPTISGAILQASVSDRDSIIHNIGEETWKSCLEMAQDWVQKGKGADVLPSEILKKFIPAPISAERWVSLTGVRGGDDFFSLDLEESDFKKTFGQLKNSKLLLLYSGADEFVPPQADKEAVIDRWRKATNPNIWSSYSCVVPGATHNIGPKSQPGALEHAVGTICKFLATETKQC